MLQLLEEYIEQGKTREIKDLLTRSPELAKQKTSKQLSPILTACYLKKPEIAEIILQFVSEPDLFECCALGRFDWVAHHVFKNPENINQFTEDGFSPLGLAVYFGHEDVTRYLLLKGAQVNQPSKNQMSVYPLHSAIAANQNMLAKMLLEAGAEVNIKQVQGITPLHAAASHGNIELIILLLEAGADVKAKMLNGKTPGDLAAEKGFQEIARILND
ncbi:MAG: ankyrin repeat domain-containing protein [Sphingobacteriaceae bacterium]